MKHYITLSIVLTLAIFIDLASPVEDSVIKEEGVINRLVDISVNYEKAEGIFVVELTGTSPIEYRTFLLPKLQSYPPVFCVEILNSHTVIENGRQYLKDFPPSFQGRQSFPISRVRLVQYSLTPPITRLVLYFRKIVIPQVTARDTKMIVTVKITPPKTSSVPPKAESVEIAEREKRTEKEVKIPQEQLVSLKFKDEELATVLLMLSRQFRANIIAGSDVTGKVSANLTNVPLKKALKYILNAEGYDFVEEYGFLKVLPLSKIRQKRKVETKPKPQQIELKTRIFRLKHAKAEELAQTLTSLLSTDGKTTFDERTNSLIVTDTPDNIVRLGDAIEQLDYEVEEKPIEKPETVEEIIPQPEEELISRVFTLNYADPSKLKTVLEPMLSDVGRIEAMERTRASTRGAATSEGAKGIGLGGSTYGGARATELGTFGGLGEDVAKGGYLIVTDKLKVIGRIEDIIEEFDKPTPQVEIQVYIIEDKIRDDSNIGWEWTAVSGEKEFEASFSGESILSLKVGNLSATEFTGVLRALSSTSDAKVLSCPRITTLQGQSALFHSGDKIPYVRTYIQEGIQSEDIVFEDVGIVLNVSPQVKENRMVSLLLSAQVSSEAGYTPGGQPRISTRRAETQVLVKDGDTAVIGGLVKDSKSHTNSGIPLLKKIPILGRLFSSRQEVVERSEITIFITPHIVTQGVENNDME